MAHALDTDQLRKITDEMVSAITHPAFVESVRRMKNIAPEERLEFGRKNLTTEALIAQGVPLPAGMRISSRYFETNADTIEIDSQDGSDDARAISVHSPHQPGQAARAGGCACGGAASVCGGAGWTVAAEEAAFS